MATPPEEPLPLENQPVIPDVLPRLKAALEGRYEVVRELGRGGMATVFLANDVKHGREVCTDLRSSRLGEAPGAQALSSPIEPSRSSG